MLTLQISQADLQVLNYERFYYPCPLVQKRLHAVYFKAKLGYSNQQVAELCDLHAYTVSKYVHCYKNQGFTGLLKVGYGTNQSELETHQSSILTDFAQHPPVSVNQAKERIQALTAIERSPSRVLAFMKRHQLSFRKLGHIPAKADSEKQALWLKEIFEPYLQKAKSGQCHLLFMDAAHFVLAPFLCAVWSVVRMFIKAPAGRKRLNVLGAVNALSQQVSLLTNTSFVNAETIACFLAQLRSEYADTPLIIVLDNARYQHCTFIKQLASQLNITLLFLPPYSPNLNMIERLWKFVKKKVLYGKYYPDFDQFQQAILTCLHDCNTLYQPQLKSLLTCRFQRFDNQTIYQI
jgi:transposase